LTDAVEKVRGMPAASNKRIKERKFLNLNCALKACFELILLGDPPQNLFSTVSTHSGHSSGRITAVRRASDLMLANAAEQFAGWIEPRSSLIQ
jgi:hypothetical protein